ncbi:MAG: primosomal protein N' [Anaerolineales bacterium]
MTEYVEIAVNVPRVSGVFHYHVPPELKGKLIPGHLVLAPFGPRVVQGVVLRHVEDPEVAETKPIDSLLDEQPVLTSIQLQLAAYLAESTLAPLAACVSLMLPAGIGQQADVEYALTGAAETDAKPLSKAQQLVLNELRERGALRGRQLERALPRRNWRSSVTALVQKGLVASKPVLPVPSAKPKTVRTAEWIADPKDAKKLGTTEATHTRRAKIISVLQRERGPVDVNWLFAESGGKLADLTMLAELELIRLGARESLRDPLAELAYDASKPPQLTADQMQVWEEVHKTLVHAKGGSQTRPMLLHGVTGSGKTEIYLRAVEKTLTLGRQAIVLVPEIALTPQTARRFLERFKDQVGLIHSELSEGEQYDTWRRARAGQLSVIVGPRSALFTPLADIGLIVIDEEHDDSYYEAGQDPHYHARDAAVAYARLAGAACLLGSATPDVGSYTQTKQQRWQLLELPARILAHRDTARAHQERLGTSARYRPISADAQALDLPAVEIVDMRRELKRGNRSIFSRALQTGLADVLKDGQQAILFLNRRGSATYVFCRSCGHVLRCPNCDNPLTQHLAKSGALYSSQTSSPRLICHHCGYKRQVPKKCPNCNSEQLRYYGTGTERVEQEVLKLFPDARTLRWDRSSTRARGSHERILQLFSQQRADVLIGTQMLAKGLDLPLVTLVGVVLADVGLQLPDYRAAERVFQVLTQVAGRAGRSPLGGQVVLQTFNPDHYAIQAAAKHDYVSFYEQESGYRRQLRYPPFAQLLRLEYRHADPRKAEQDARQMAKRMEHLLEAGERSATEMIGPAPCFYPRLNRQYRWQILLRGPDPASMLRGIKLIGWRVEVNPPSLL